jgi:hypothetical protein
MIPNVVCIRVSYIRMYLYGKYFNTGGCYPLCRDRYQPGGELSVSTEDGL